MTKLNNLSGKSYLTSLILLRKSVIVYLCICIFVIVGTVTREQRKEGERINCWRNIRRGAVTGTNCSHVIHLTAKQRKQPKTFGRKREFRKKCDTEFWRWAFPHLHSKFPSEAFIPKFYPTPSHQNKNTLLCIYFEGRMLPISCLSERSIASVVDWINIYSGRW